MSSSIFFREINRLLIVSIFIPSHEDSVLKERESLKLTLLIYLYRSLAFIEWSSDSISIFCDHYSSPIEKDDVLVGRAQKIFIFIDLKE